MLTEEEIRWATKTCLERYYQLGFRRLGVRCHEAARMFAALLPELLGIECSVRDGSAQYRLGLVMDFARRMIPRQVLHGPIELLPEKIREVPTILPFEHSWVVVDGWGIDFHPWMQLDHEAMFHIEGFLVLFREEGEDDKKSRCRHWPEAVATTDDQGRTVITYPRLGREIIVRDFPKL